jgi:hypothetical protein
MFLWCQYNRLLASFLSHAEAEAQRKNLILEMSARSLIIYVVIFQSNRIEDHNFNMVCVHIK